MVRFSWALPFAAVNLNIVAGCEIEQLTVKATGTGLSPI